MAKKSITRRWITNNLGVIVLILLVIELALIYAVQNYYYNSARQNLVSKINAVNGVLTRVLQRVDMPDGTMRAVLRGLKRIRCNSVFKEYSGGVAVDYSVLPDEDLMSRKDGAACIRALSSGGQISRITSSIVFFLSIRKAEHPSHIHLQLMEIRIQAISAVLRIIKVSVSILTDRTDLLICRNP